LGFCVYDRLHIIMCLTGRYDYSFIKHAQLLQTVFQNSVEKSIMRAFILKSIMRDVNIFPRILLVCWANHHNKRVQITQPKKSAKSHRNRPTKNERLHTCIIISYHTVHQLPIFFSTEKLTTCEFYKKNPKSLYLPND